jgi:hypothetical protein
MNEKNAVYDQWRRGWLTQNPHTVRAAISFRGLCLIMAVEGPVPGSVTAPARHKVARFGSCVQWRNFRKRTVLILPVKVSSFLFKKLRCEFSTTRFQQLNSYFNPSSVIVSDPLS